MKKPEFAAKLLVILMEILLEVAEATTEHGVSYALSAWLNVGFAELGRFAMA